ncbi:MAG: glycosyltransferase family 4 protein [Pirellulales bacterium]
MKVVIVAGPFFSVPPAPSGAVQRVWNDLAPYFTARGHEVTIVCRDHPALPKDIGGERLRYIRSPQYRQTGRLPIDLIKDCVYSLGVQWRLPAADIYVLNAFWLPVFTPRLQGTHRAYAVAVQRMPKGQFWLYPRCQRFSAVSHAVADALAKENPSYAARTRVIANPIHTDVFVPPQQRAWGDAPQTILYTGRIHPEKGLHLLIDAFRLIHERHPTTRLRLVGPVRAAEGGGGEAFQDSLARKAHSLPVEFGAAINDRPGLARELQAAHYYCYPSTADAGETFGVAPLEAMATGLPTVVSALSCFTDFVRDGENALVFDHRAPDAANRLAAALDRLVTAPALREQLSREAASTAARFSYEAIADAYLADFASLLAAS